MAKKKDEMVEGESAGVMAEAPRVDRRKGPRGPSKQFSREMEGPAGSKISICSEPRHFSTSIDNGNSVLSLVSEKRGSSSSPTHATYASFAEGGKDRLTIHVASDGTAHLSVVLPSGLHKSVSLNRLEDLVGNDA